MSDRLLNLINNKLQGIQYSAIELGDAVIRIDRANLKSCFVDLKNEAEFSFDLLLSVTATDFLNQETDPEVKERFEVVYHLLSLKNQQRLRVKVWVPEESLSVDTISDLWSGANFMEREVWDMYGISFNGHPDQRRILMYDEFVGHPLRKDYPVQGKQPRIPMLNPEVRNTAVDMVRPALVKINRKKSPQLQVTQ